MNRKLAYVRLTLIDGIGPKTVKKLLEHFGDVEKIFNASPSEISIATRLRLDKAEELLSEKNLKNSEDLLHFCEDNSVEIILPDDESYPRLLREIASPPFVLFLRGNARVLSAPQIAIVGTRKPTPYGLRSAEEFAYQLSALGVVVTSGLALGIDTAAHKGALKANRPTVAVLATGCEKIYPPENEKLAKEILKTGGVLVSEFPPNTAVRKQNFPNRNRIISGLSLGVLVAEAPEDSGALITASYAIEQNRQVFAIPARIDEKNFVGAMRLIQQGAKLVLSVKDIIEELPPFESLAETRLGIPSTSDKTTPQTLDQEERIILDSLSAGSLDPSGIARKTGMLVQRVSAVLLKLQLKGAVVALPGNRYELKP